MAETEADLELAQTVAEHAEHSSGGPAELAEVGTLYVKRGKWLRVTVKDAGQGGGPMVDLRPWTTPSAYPTTAARPQKQALKARAKGWKERPTSTTGYRGPNKGGAWLSSGQALELAEVLTRAGLEAEAQAERGAA